MLLRNVWVFLNHFNFPVEVKENFDICLANLQLLYGQTIKAFYKPISLFSLH